MVDPRALVGAARTKQAPEVPAGPLVLLTYRAPAAKRADLLAFLTAAFPFYESPGGVRMALYESVDEPGLFVELVAYATRADYERDQARVEGDPEMREWLARWRSHVDGPVEVRRVAPVAVPRTGPAPAHAVCDAAYNDHDSITALLAAAALPIPGAGDAPVSMLVVRESGKVIGCVGTEEHGTAALLRSLAVTSSARGRGLGAALVDAALLRLQARGAREVVVLTLTARDFFVRLGFREIDRADVPADLQRSPELASASCASAACLRLTLPG